MNKLARAIDDIRRKWVPDARLGVFEVDEKLSGITSSRAAQEAVRSLAAASGLAERVRLLPDETVGEDVVGVVTAALAPLLGRNDLQAPRVSEALHGECLEILERHDQWLRVRAADEYVAWTHAGYVAAGPPEWARDWTERATARSLGADLNVGGDRRRLPTGARLVLRRDGAVQVADGQIGRVVHGAVRSELELRAEARMIAIPELALKWYGGAPYLWGGRTEWGIDCSGLVQAVYEARGIRLLRDSDQQFGQGRAVALTADGTGYEAGDLLFFAEGGRVSHVALWSGAGRVVHSALSRGGVGSDHLFGDEPRMVRLAANLVGVRRLT